MKDHKSIDIIIDNDRCVSCGACVYVCPNKNIYMLYNSIRGKWEAKNDTAKCGSCNGEYNCLSVCPSYKVNYLELANSHKNCLLGEIDKVNIGYSNNQEIRTTSSSGGVIKEICIKLLTEEKVDGIITLQHAKGLDYVPVLLKDVSNMPNSIYHNIDFSNTFNILKKEKGKFVIIGLPCQLTSIELLLKKEMYRHLKEKVYLKIGLICGYTFDRKNMEAFAFYNRLKMDSISYRERGRYRKTRVFYSGKSKVFDVHYPKSFLRFLNNSIMFDKYLPQLNCLFCVDHLNYNADIVIGGAWLKRYRKDFIGTNILISRSNFGSSIIESVSSIELIETDKKDIVNSQHDRKAFGSVGEGMRLYYSKKKKFVPLFTRSNNVSDLKIEKIKLGAKLKIIFLKRLLQQGRFHSARFLYFIIDYKLLPTYFAIRILKILKIR